MIYEVTHSTTYRYTEVAADSHSEVHLSPRRTAWQHVHMDELTIVPEPTSWNKRTDYFGNTVVYFALPESHHQLSITATSIVEVFPRPMPAEQPCPPWEVIRDAVATARTSEDLNACHFLYASPNVRKSQLLREYAWPSFLPGRPLCDAAMDLTTRIHKDLAYAPASTTIDTPVELVLQQRRGVCQDFAHVAIGCLRALGIPARYVSGYLRTYPPAGRPKLIGADASHAWFSVYMGPLGWVDYDPTNNIRPSEEHITVGWGRDYSDVPPVRGAVVGGGLQALIVAVDVAPQRRVNLR